MAEIEALGRCSAFIRADVSRPEENERLVAETVERFGRLDAFVANAGVARWQPLADVTRDDWDFIMGVNLHGVFHGCRAAAAQMRRQGDGGSIVVISSVNAVMPFSPLGVYGASKHAVGLLVGVMAREWGDDGIAVNHVGPGWVDSDINVPSPDFDTEEKRAAVDASIPSRPPSDEAARDRRSGRLPPRVEDRHRRVRSRRRRTRGREVLMRVLLVAPQEDPLEPELAALGLELTRDGAGAEGLVTVAPRVELEPLSEQGSADWLRTFDLWATEPFFAAQPWLVAAVERGSGSWVAVTSTIGTQPFPGGGAPGAGAMALQTLVRVAALEGGPHGVRANVVAPGWSDSTMPRELDAELAVADTPLRRLATPGDIAQAVAWLLSDRASHVTGEVIRVDGGYTITRGSRPDPRKE